MPIHRDSIGVDHIDEAIKTKNRTKSRISLARRALDRSD